jgi:hypothetical protein
MATDETADLVTAFLIGAALGVGAILLLRSEPENEVENILREVGLTGRGGAKHRRAGTMQKRVRKLRKRVKQAVPAEALDGFRDEIAGIVDAARNEIVHTAKNTVREARSALRRRLS